MPVFEHVSHYPFPRAEVFGWHTRAGAFQRLTPPGMATILAGSHEGLALGSDVLLRVSHPLIAALVPAVGFRGCRGPVGLNWLVRLVDVAPGEHFVDDQVSGPFRSWHHEHLFADGADGSTAITDRVTWELPPGLGAVRPLVESQLRALFTFREHQLRDDLTLHAAVDSAPRTVVISGASGLIGRQVRALFTTGGHQVRRLVRSAAVSSDAIRWDPSAARIPGDALAGIDVAVNLSGHSIGGRFSAANKQAILLSRVGAATTLARALAAQAPAATLVQASAVGVYGARRPGEILTENSSAGDGFLADVVRAWEAAAAPAASAGLRTTFLRTGIVLTEGGGVLAPQLPLYALFVGGRLAAADAWLSWITLDDIARAYVHAALTTSLEGPVNAVGPTPVTNGVFASTLGRVLGRPSLVPTPAVGPTALLGAEGYDQLVRTDQRVRPAKLTGAGFTFAQPSLEGALRHVLRR
ncbi:MAG: TIGR01777 family oxidoreductase [Propioniciclava sp.]